MSNTQSTIIIIPAKNEATTIQAVIQDIQHHFSGQILVIDDASTDDTVQIAEQAGAKVLSLAFSLGAWGAIQTGLRYALKHQYQTAITMDADGQHEANSINTLLTSLTKQHTDVVIGAFTERGSLLRRVAWYLFRQLSDINFKDLTSGLRVYNRRAIKLLASQEATLLEYQDLGVLMLLQRAGLSIQEVPIQMQPRVVGHSRIFNSWWAVTKYMIYTTILCIALPKAKRKKKPLCRTK